MKFIQPPYFAKRYYPDALWRFSIDDKRLFLTFDDGPHPSITADVLKLLDQYSAKATFFCVGDNVRKYGDVYNQIQEKGHAIGNHTYHHLNGWKNSLLTYAKNITKASKEIESKLFRPPYGKITQKQVQFLKSHQYLLVMWDILTYDWAEIPNLEKHYKKIAKSINPGSIIVFHDSEKAKVNMLYLLEKVLDEFSKKGYKFATISNLDVMR